MDLPLRRGEVRNATVQSRLAPGLEDGERDVVVVHRRDDRGKGAQVGLLSRPRELVVMDDAPDGGLGLGTHFDPAANATSFRQRLADRLIWSRMIEAGMLVAVDTMPVTTARRASC